VTRPRIYNQLDADLEDGLRILGQLEAIGTRMANRAPDALSAAAYDREHGGAIAWCDTHEREVEACRRKLMACRGVPLPRYTDRVGDEVVGQVLTHAWEMQDAARMVTAGMRAMARVARIYGKDDLDPAAEQITTDIEENNKPKCQHHMRHGWLIDARGKHPTRVVHRGQPLLDTPLRLCRWCQDTVVDAYTNSGERRLPQQSELRRHSLRMGLPGCSIPAAPGDSTDVRKYLESQIPEALRVG
jgi:hypothetical protein